MAVKTYLVIFKTVVRYQLKIEAESEQQAEQMACDMDSFQIERGEEIYYEENIESVEEEET